MTAAAAVMSAGLPEVTAWLRPKSGTNFCSKLRKVGMPCTLRYQPAQYPVFSSKLALYYYKASICLQNDMTLLVCCGVCIHAGGPHAVCAV